MMKIFSDIYIKKIIFSYLRSKPKLACVRCGEVIVWDKNAIISYISYPLLDNSLWQSECGKCYTIYNCGIVSAYT